MYSSTDKREYRVKKSINSAIKMTLQREGAPSCLDFGIWLFSTAMLLPLLVLNRSRPWPGYGSLSMHSYPWRGVYMSAGMSVCKCGGEVCDARHQEVAFIPYQAIARMRHVATRYCPWQTFGGGAELPARFGSMCCSLPQLQERVPLPCP
jgi:hypothetical protein